MKYAIETFDLTKRDGNFLAVDALNMKIDNNGMFGFLGPNSTENTSTIKMIMCFISPTGGTVNGGKC